MRDQLSMVAYRQPVLLDLNVFVKDAAVGAAVGARVSPELAGARVGASVGVGGAQFLMKTRQLQHRAKYWEPDAPRLLPDLSEFPPVREPQWVGPAPCSPWGQPLCCSGSWRGARDGGGGHRWGWGQRRRV